jgi:hypothetical protein
MAHKPKGRSTDIPGPVYHVPGSIGEDIEKYKEYKGTHKGKGMMKGASFTRDSDRMHPETKKKIRDQEPVR